MSKVLFLANHFITLHSFRKEIIQRMVNDGHEVWLSLPEDPDNEFFSKMGCKIIPTKISRRGINPIKDIQLVCQYRHIFKKVQPDITFSFTIKPNIYGTLASNSIGYKQVCNITGTGATFLRKGFVATICINLYRISVRKCYKTFFQNSGDKDFFISHDMVNKDKCEMLPGSGCNLEQHAFKPLPSTNHLNFIYIGRVMKLKGIDEYLACAQTIHGKYPNATFYIAGWNEEPEYMKKVENAQKGGYVEYLGFRKDIDKWIERCHCTILASYGGEGVPNVLLESAATGRICIASNINGSRDVIEDGITGYLFEKGNAADLISKVEKFILLSDEEKSSMGLAGRKKVEKEFDRNIVIEKYVEEVNSCTNI
jgi:galacturonosyltransferase